MSPPLAATNPLLISKDLFGSQEVNFTFSSLKVSSIIKFPSLSPSSGCWPPSVVFQSPWAEEETEDRWLSQVEIVTHIGPGKKLTGFSKNNPQIFFYLQLEDCGWDLSFCLELFNILDKSEF